MLEVCRVGPISPALSGDNVAVDTDIQLLSGLKQHGADIGGWRGVTLWSRRGGDRAAGRPSRLLGLSLPLPRPKRDQPFRRHSVFPWPLGHITLNRVETPAGPFSWAGWDAVAGEKRSLGIPGRLRGPFGVRDWAGRAEPTWRAARVSLGGREATQSPALPRRARHHGPSSYASSPIYVPRRSSASATGRMRPCTDGTRAPSSMTDPLQLACRSQQVAATGAQQMML